MRFRYCLPVAGRLLGAFRNLGLGLLAGLLIASSALAQDVSFQERYRPQFHYTAVKGWINDPIGLLYYEGEYHLFNDHNVKSTRFPGGKLDGEQSHWSHAVSKNLIHWEHMPVAVYPDRLGACWSGSGVVDWKNTTGFQTGKEPPLVLAYTSAGSWGQSLIYSNDRGRSWTKHEGNPVLDKIADSNRDPQVFWHEPTKKWIMVLYVRRGQAHFFKSNDMKTWTATSVVPLVGFHECPDMFRLPVDGDPKNCKWVIYDGPFHYWIGDFDGERFQPQTPALRCEFGKNFHAAQSWETPDRRRVQIGWMNGGVYPGMPFNQQMTFPCELTLRTTADGVRLFMYPIEAIQNLYTKSFSLKNHILKPGDNPLDDMTGELFDIEMAVEPGDATEFGLRLHETAVVYSNNQIVCAGAKANVSPIDGVITLRILVDRASIETFVNDGQVALPCCVLPKKLNTGLDLYAKGGNVTIRSLRVTRLKSCWESRDTQSGLLAAPGAQGGLVVNLGCRDGKLTTALRANDSYLVHRLDTNSEDVKEARKYNQTKGLYGKVTVDTFDGRRPNVLFLCVDDMKDWVNCLGGYEGTVRTPNIDRLAKRGMLFTNAHCPSPKCAPSRTAIMTGLRPSTTGLYDNGHWWLPNLPDVVTIPMHFRNHGYRVVGAGKVFHHTAGNHPPNQWDDFQRLTFREAPWFRGVKLNYPWSKHEPYPHEFPFSGVKGLGHENDWGALGIRDEEYDDALATDYAVRFLERKQGDNGASESKPFFLACGLFRPHLPWYVPQKYFDMYSLDDIELPTVPDDDLDDLPAEGLKFAKARRSDFETIKSAGKWKHAVRAYLASISCADARIGRVLDALDRSPHATNTIIVLWSDHGWHLGEKQHWHKTTLWEEATRVPLIVSAPDYRPGVCDLPVSLLDLYPTLSELTRFDADKSRDGVSLVPLLRNPKAQWNRPAVIEFKRGNAAVRSDRYRYIRYRDGGEELYDHQTDPHEWNNLAVSEEHAAIKKQLAGWITKDWAESAPTKGAFRFDHNAFTWTNEKTGVVTRGDDQ